MKAKSLLLTIVLAVSSMTILPSTQAHPCYEGQGAGSIDCGECVDGEDHHHEFEDGSDCTTNGPCHEVGCNTYQGLCKDFPVVCGAIHDVAILR